MKGTGRQIEEVLTAWEGIEAHPHRFGGPEFLLGSREIGHVHEGMRAAHTGYAGNLGDGLVDIPFPVKVRDEVIAAGLAEPHHILPDSGWVSLWLREPSDVDKALKLFECSYELAQRARREARAEAT
ncbi:MAG: DUF5519 family protein [Thermaceae bacterium]|nr:DUF5519 family protein [Thermaceae bacterium]